VDSALPPETFRASATGDAFYFSTGLVLLQNGERLFAYNEASAKLWACLQTGAALDDLRDLLAKEYGVSLEQAGEDAQRAVDDWLSHGLIERSGVSDVLTQVGKSYQTDPTGTPPNSECEAPFPHSATSWATFWARRAIEFSVDHPELEALLRHQFPEADCANAERATTVQIRRLPGDGLLLMIDGRERLRSEQPQQILGRLIQEVVEFLHPGKKFLAFMHGGAVAKNGRAYAFTAPSGSGKSTLVAYLSHEGYRFLCDDVIVLSAPEGFILPFPAAMSIKPGSVSVLSRYYPELPGASAIPSMKGNIRFIRPRNDSNSTDDNIPLSKLIFPIYDPTSRSELHTMSPLEALARLLADSIWFGHPIARTKVQSFLDWLEGTPTYSLRFSDLNEAGVLLDRLALE